MYCPKCGKKLPDGARFCDQCGANLTGGSVNNSQSGNNDVMIGLIVIFISAILLFLGWPIVKYWDYINFAKLQSYPEVQARLLFLILGVTGVLCGIIIAVRSSNEVAESNRTPAPIPKPEPEKSEEKHTLKRAMQVKIKGLNGVIKCSRCGTEQDVERTVCKKCGAEFINRKAH